MGRHVFRSLVARAITLGNSGNLHKLKTAAMDEWTPDGISLLS